MTRPETEAELSDVQAQIARLQIRELFLQTRLRHTKNADAKVAGADDAGRPGWPIARTAQSSGCRISTSAAFLIAV